MGAQPRPHLILQALAMLIVGLSALLWQENSQGQSRGDASLRIEYQNVGTGNYNESTATLYTDISYMTCNENLATEASMFFNTITGYSQPQAYHLIEVAPYSLRDRF